jgi:hypothetical protein
MPYSHPTLQRAVLESHSRGSADAGSIPAAFTSGFKPNMDRDDPAGPPEVILVDRREA